MKHHDNQEKRLLHDMCSSKQASTGLQHRVGSGFIIQTVQHQPLAQRNPLLGKRDVFGM